ncbi:hypothetical protein [uncultured Methanobrevibacter sp.]|uniref:hypothetical protein n=1 Tax=uncultured Methanobrevibacter sp. TaxID=253161 RepID=UPI002620EAEF|nr:hypothetical protein [uncultured Methanobrevibacter sp.]
MKKIFTILIIFAVLITCAGVSFASSDFDDSFIEDSDIDDYDLSDDLDDELIDDSDDESDDDLSDEDLDDEDWDDDLDDEDLDDEDWDDDLDDEDLDDEDWDDDFDDEDLDDEDWDDYDYPNGDDWEYYYDDLDWSEWEYYYDDLDFIDDFNESDGNRTFLKKIYLYANSPKYLMAYTTNSKAFGFTQDAANYDQKDFDNESDYDDEKVAYHAELPIPFLDLGFEEIKWPYESPSASVSKSIYLENINGDLSNNESDTNKTDESVNIIDINVASEEFESDILAILALVIICIIAII